MKFVIIPELKGFWVWELRGNDGMPIARSSGLFAHKAEVVADIRKVRAAAGRAQTFDLVGTPQEDGLMSVVTSLLQSPATASAARVSTTALKVTPRPPGYCVVVPD